MIQCRTAILAAATLVSAICGPARADDYPSHPVTIIVPFAAGGTVDILGRLAAEVLQKELHQSVIVENRTGAGGVIGNTVVARSAPDGYTLLLAPTAFAIVPYIYRSLPYDPLRDFKPVSLIGLTANVMVVSPSLQVGSLKEFIDLARSGRAKITYASPGIGTPQHLAVEYFAAQAGIKMEHAPYGGSSPALLGLMSGDVGMMFADIAPAVPLIQSGKIRALAVATATRHPSLPDIPSISETLPGVSSSGWQALLARAGTPDEIVNRLNAALIAYLKTPEAAQRLRDVGVDVKWSSPRETTEWITAQLDLWRETARQAGLKPQ